MFKIFSQFLKPSNPYLFLSLNVGRQCYKLQRWECAVHTIMSTVKLEWARLGPACVRLICASFENTIHCNRSVFFSVHDFHCERSKECIRFCNYVCACVFIFVSANTITTVRVVWILFLEKKISSSDSDFRKTEDLFLHKISIKMLFLDIEKTWRLENLRQGLF